MKQVFQITSLPKYNSYLKKLALQRIPFNIFNIFMMCKHHCHLILVTFQLLPRRNPILQSSFSSNIPHFLANIDLLVSTDFPLIFWTFPMNVIYGLTHLAFFHLA